MCAIVLYASAYFCVLVMRVRGMWPIVILSSNCIRFKSHYCTPPAHPTVTDISETSLPGSHSLVSLGTLLSDGARPPASSYPGLRMLQVPA